jgi:hypothetical protein
MRSNGPATLVGEGDLVRRQRDADHIDIIVAVKIEREAAPAAADIEHPHARLEVQLGGDMRLLVELRLLEAVAGGAIVSAGILPVLVEEQFIEAPRQIVGVLGIAPRARLPIDLINPAGQRAHRLPQQALRLERALALPRRIVAGKQDQVADVALLDDEAAVHIGLAGADPRIGCDRHRSTAVGQPDLDRIPSRFSGTVKILPAVVIDDREFASLDETAEHFVEEPHQ